MWTSALGLYAVCLAWGLTFYAMLVGSLGAGRQAMSLVRSAGRATIAVAVATVVSVLSLGLGFLSDDYSTQYIWQYSNHDMPAVYKFSAIWGGMDGSMLLWGAILALGAAAFAACRRESATLGWIIACVNSSTCFFLTIVVFVSNPFRAINSSFIPPEGNGLNPLLQNPFMAAHPPTLYLGFTLLALPAAIVMGALISRDDSDEWLHAARTWALIAWFFLSAGIVLGGYWAYIELGWGGFWAWDPVENSSFLPWLTATAFLHSVMVQERKGMLKTWNVWLLIASYLLSVFGTFLTRSGVVQRVHSFASTNVGWVFLLYIGVVFCLAAVLIWRRREVLRSEVRFEAIVSREVVFLLNNLALLSICFAVLWGVMFPVFSEAITGQKQMVGIPYFNAVSVPLFLGLLLMMAVGPWCGWGYYNLRQILRLLVLPLVAALALGALLIWVGVTKFAPVLAFCLSAFVVGTIVVHMHRGIRGVRAAHDRPSSALRVASRWGGHIAHFGVCIMAVAISASLAYKFEQEFTLSKGQQATLAQYQLTLKDIGARQTGGYEAIQASVDLKTNGAGSLQLRPELRFYGRNQESTSEVALHSGLLRDVYLVLIGIDDDGNRASFKIFINPLQVWLWIGAAVMLAGALLSILTRCQNRPANEITELNRPTATAV